MPLPQFHSQPITMPSTTCTNQHHQYQRRALHCVDRCSPHQPQCQPTNQLTSHQTSHLKQFSLAFTIAIPSSPRLRLNTSLNLKCQRYHLPPSYWQHVWCVTLHKNAMQSFLMIVNLDVQPHPLVTPSRHCQHHLRLHHQ